ncbi:unnamed protein product [Diatraea saccharalis]|uniref:Breast cancer type 1 susceptibility protein homolog n=1 Tax=Diatraea saccharalis TaxID=40085 RepID=A0A9N9W8F1_9NEOP|nr:unnamed protein product [Diatraea saccharalis]
MNLRDLDVVLLTKLTSQQVDNVTCLECCKYYIAPETAACGHTLCHTCWRGRRSCPSCAAPLEKRLLKLNIPMQTRTEHIHALGEALEKLFNIKLDEFALDVSIPEVESLDNNTKNVKDWLASSQNHFSAPLINSETLSQEVNNPIEISSSKIQIHNNTKKSISPSKVVYIQQVQDDWDKIEQLPDIDERSINKENMDSKNKNILSLIDENEYSLDNPRRSSRKRDLNQTEPTIKDESLEKLNSKNYSADTDQKSNKNKQNWNNVKRMRKEFSKLNKQNRNKLNVSIEMCKKAQSAISKTDIEPEKNTETACLPLEYTIEDNTPIDIGIKEKPKDKEQKCLSEIPKNNPSMKVAHEIEHNISKDTILHKEINPPSSSSKNDSLISEGNINKALIRCTPKTSLENIDDNLNNKSTKMSFIKKGNLCPKLDERTNAQTVNIDDGINNDNENSDDIEITIKIGNTLTNIVIKKKTNDVQLKVNTDREVQTSLGENCLVNINNKFTKSQNDNQQKTEKNLKNDNDVSTIKLQSNNAKIHTTHELVHKSLSTKKNTASAETATAQFEITESVEKELSKIMECDEIIKVNRLSYKNEEFCSKNTLQLSSVTKHVNKIAIENNNKHALNETQITDDLEIFDCDSNSVPIVDQLKNSKHAPSDILMPTVKSTKHTNHPDKRDREMDEDETPNPKKFKLTTEKCTDENLPDLIIDENNKNKIVENDSLNYDVVMDQVFASIDADIQTSGDGIKKQDMLLSKDAPEISENKNIVASANESQAKGYADEKFSENVFSIVEKDVDSHDLINKAINEDGSTQRHIDNLLTPRMCQDLVATHEENLIPNREIGNKDNCTPYQEQDDSDRSVVEETPQKNIPFAKPKGNNEINMPSSEKGITNDNSDAIKTIINVSDSIEDTTKSNKDVTIIDFDKKKQALETPLTINRFVDHIKHKSTPVARKSLNFDSENIVDDDDPEQTLCPSSVIAKTTQEKEFMCKAFEETQKSPVKKPLLTKNTRVNDLKYCIAGSCLSTAELNNVKLLCRKHNWKYIDKYSKELTHLVVGVDEENKSQRSVKYMCALAASKWIVAYEWVENCLKTNLIVAENQFEALDGTGEPGPKRSRLAKKKLFQGITFFCMPPFSVLDINTLKEMLAASGGRVVDEAKAVKATSDSPALLLAEPENTQEDRFMYLALELGIVPVNYEWVLNCLGSYTLSSIHELLLCPSALLPQVTTKWPSVLISNDSE